MLTQALVLIAVVLLHLISPFGVLNALAPREGIRFVQDVPYAPGDRHTLDVYAPAHGPGAAPVLVFFYGGGWESGDKATYRYLGSALAARGIVVMIPDYRLHPAVRFPAFVQDGATAVAWAYDNAGRFGGDPKRLFLMGHSAGAQIAALLALNGEYLSAAGLSARRDLCGVVGLAGAYDFLRDGAPHVQAIFGAPSEWPRAQPITYASAQSPPMLLLAGDRDRTLDPGNTLRLAAALQAAGAEAHAELARGISHRAIVVAFAEALSFLTPVRDQVVRFVTKPCGA